MGYENIEAIVGEMIGLLEAVRADYEADILQRMTTARKGTRDYVTWLCGLDVWGGAGSMRDVYFHPQNGNVSDDFDRDNMRWLSLLKGLARELRPLSDNPNVLAELENSVSVAGRYYEQRLRTKDEVTRQAQADGLSEFETEVRMTKALRPPPGPLSKALTETAFLLDVMGETKWADELRTHIEAHEYDSALEKIVAGSRYWEPNNSLLSLVTTPSVTMLTCPEETRRRYAGLLAKIRRIMRQSSGAERNDVDWLLDYASQRFLG